MASEYGWTFRTIERELTDEHLVLLLDEGADRRAARHDDAIDAVRSGWIFAHDQKQYVRWRSDANRRAGRQSPGTTIEQLAREYPDHVGLPN